MRSLKSRDEEKSDRSINPKHKNKVGRSSGQSKSNKKVRSLTSRDEEKKKRHKDKICHTCGELGHIKFNCPSSAAAVCFSTNNEDNNQIMGCLNCDNIGHLERDCPYLQQLSDNPSMAGRHYLLVLCR